MVPHAEIFLTQQSVSDAHTVDNTEVRQQNTIQVQAGQTIPPKGQAALVGRLILYYILYLILNRSVQIQDFHTIKIILNLC